MSSSLPRMDLDAMVPLPTLKTQCGPGRGFGMAVCPTLGLLVTSNLDDNSLTVFALPGCIKPGTDGGGGVGLTRVCTLGGDWSPAPMQFKFQDEFCEVSWPSGFVAFMGPATSRLLLATDAGHNAVHVIDVAGRVHVGYVATPGAIAGPRGVAATGSLVAVSCWNYLEHVVRVFEGSGAMWIAVRVVDGDFGGPGSADGQLHVPFGLRFTCDGKGLAVADAYNDRVSVFLVEDGSFVRHVSRGLDRPYDVEECEGGWLVACPLTHTIAAVGGGSVGSGGDSGEGRARLGKWGTWDGEFMWPSALALVPGLGLVVRELDNGGRVQVFVTPDAIAMASMSARRVAWMVAVARGGSRRSQGSAIPLAHETRTRQRGKRGRVEPH